MLDTTKKSRRIIVERIDLRTHPQAKTDIFRISIGDAILIEVSPEELKKLTKIAQSYSEIKSKKNQSHGKN